jgi:multidrug resistance efflux pump
MASPFLRSVRSLESDNFRGWAWGLAVVSILLALWLVWFFNARVSVYAVSDSADLEVDRAAHAVEAQFSGRVVASSLLLDREVQAGEILVQLDADAQNLQLNEERTRFAALRPQIASIEDEIASEDKAWQQEHGAAAVALDEARAHNTEAEAAAGFAELEAKRLQQMYSSGVLSQEESERGQSQAQQRRAAADGLRLAVIRLERQQRTEEEDRHSHIQGLRSEVKRLRGLEATTAAEVTRLEQEVDRRMVRAPVNGRLGEVANLRAGTVVREGEKLAAIVPPGKLRIVANFLPPDALGRVHPAQYARMNLEGFPWTQFGSLQATVTSVASEVREGRIRVELSVNLENTVRIPVQHGLPGTVEVQVERISPAALVLRTAGQWLAAPHTTVAPSGAQP